MRIGVPKEIKNNEYRVALVPATVRELVKNGHQVFVETKAGEGIDISDKDYREAGAEIVNTAKEAFDNAELILKVKEPQPQECGYLREGQTLFTYLHLAADKKQTELLLESGCAAIAYETVTDARGGLPLLAPMSEVAGRVAIQAGAHCLEKAQGGRGILLSGVPGVASASVVVLGGGVVGSNAIRMALGAQAQVTVLDKSVTRLKDLDEQFGGQLNTIFSTQDAIEKYTALADLLIGAVLVPGAEAPKIVSTELIKKMRPGTVVVDVAIDQGGCFASSRPTTHEKPTYTVDNVVHYCVSNMPAAVPRTSTFALTHATFPYILALANKGIQNALAADKHLRNGLNICRGQITHQAVAEVFHKSYIPAEEILSA
ncbi:MAG: alanine dehydrogenase [Pseudomonadota bacterium]